MRHDLVARGAVEDLVLRPQDRPWGDGVYPYAWAKFNGQCTRQAKQAGFRRAIQWLSLIHI